MQQPKVIFNAPDFAQDMIRIMGERKISNNDLARVTGVHLSQVCRMRTRDHVHKIDTIYSIAVELGMDVESYMIRRGKNHVRVHQPSEPGSYCES